MIDGTKLPKTDRIYTFIRRDGRNIHIHSARLRDHCLALKYPIIRAPLWKPLAHQFIRDNVVSLARVAQLMQKPSREPIILCKTEAFGANDPLTPDVLLVDGHHRYTAAIIERHTNIRAWLLDLHQWLPFQVSGIADETHESLKSHPIPSDPRFSPWLRVIKGDKS